MKTLLGFYCIWHRSSLMGGQYMVTYCDDGFGNLVPSTFPAHSIETANA